jgi:hypothetical protein
LLPPRPTPKLEDHPLSTVRDCLFKIFATTLHNWRPFLHPQPEDAPCRGDSTGPTYHGTNTNTNTTTTTTNNNNNNNNNLLLLMGDEKLFSLVYIFVERKTGIGIGMHSKTKRINYCYLALNSMFLGVLQ